MNKPKYILALLLCMVLVSCKKFVDIKKSSLLSQIETANDCQLIMDNYSLFNANYPSDGETSAADYYIDNFTYNDGNTSIEDKSIYNWEPQAIRAGGQQWVKSYNKIYNTNLVLEALAKLEGKENPAVINHLKGTALFLRAYALWNLAQLYAKPYGATAAQDAGLPIRLISDVNETPGRGTVKDTYDRIVQDLRDAAAMMNVTADLPSRPTKIAALAMLARVYLSMEDYPNALTNASAALALKSDLLDFNTFDEENPFPFTRYNKEVIFHSILESSALLAAGSAESNFAKIENNLIGSYTNNDLRKTFFYKANSGQNEGSFRFTGNYEPSSSSTLFNGLAVDELYLIRAECFARANNAAGAIADLNTLLRTRWTTGTYVDLPVSTADAALTTVLTERRKELVMRGQRWTDLRRLNKDSRFAVTISRSGGGVLRTLPVNDSRYTLLIPQEVITYSTISQNPR